MARTNWNQCLESILEHTLEMVKRGESTETIQELFSKTVTQAIEIAKQVKK